MRLIIMVPGLSYQDFKPFRQGQSSLSIVECKKGWDFQFQSGSHVQEVKRSHTISGRPFFRDTNGTFENAVWKRFLEINTRRDVDGLMTKHPKHGEGELIRQVDHIGSSIESIAHAAPGSEGGTGGMMTKIRAAKYATSRGVAMVIASGKKEGILKTLVSGKPSGTYFSAH